MKVIAISVHEIFDMFHHLNKTAVVAANWAA
jgi:hypothetical protein